MGRAPGGAEIAIIADREAGFIAFPALISAGSRATVMRHRS